MEGTEIVSQSTTVDYIIVAVAGGILTYIGKSLWDRFVSEHMASTADLLERLDKNKIGTKGLRRLDSETARIRNDVSARLPLPKTNFTALCWPTESPCVVLRSSNVPLLETSCPTTAESANPHLYMKPMLPENLVHIEDEEVLFHAVFNQIKVVINQIPHCEKLWMLDLRDKPVYTDVWINASEYIWSRYDLVVRSFNNLEQGIKRNYPFLRTIVEITVSDDIYNDFSKHYSSTYLTVGDFHTDTSQFNGLITNSALSIQYLNSRNYAYDLLRQGVVLSLRDTANPLPLPDELLEKRLSKLCKSFPASGWKSLWIYGVPGSGKSELARKFGDYLKSEDRAVVLVLSVLDFAEESYMLENGSLSRDATLEILTKLVKKRLVQLFSETKIARLVCSHVAEKFVQQEHKNIVLLADEIDHLRILRQATTSLLRSIPNLGIKMISVSRSTPPMNALPKSEIYVKKINSFTLKEAKLILGRWLSELSTEEVTDLVDEGWLSRMDDISLYMLRLVSESLYAGGQQPPRLLRIAIDGIVGPIENIVFGNPSHETAYMFLDKTRNLLEDENVRIDEIRAILPESRDINLIELLGNLAWFSKYRIQEPITPSSLIEWSCGSITDMDTAEHFLEEGVRAGIFSGSMNAMMWRDQFLADGCAVIKIQSETNHSTIAELTTVLVEQNASEILGLAADLDTFKRIVDAVFVSNKSIPIKVMDGLFSKQAVKLLRDHPELFDFVSMKLLNLSDKLVRSEKILLSQLLARMAEHCEKLEIYMSQSLSSNEQIAEIAALVCGHLRNSEQYLEDCRSLGGRNAIHALSSAAVIWPAEEGNRLAHWCDEKTDIAQKKRCEIFREWCDRRSLNDLVNFVSYIGKNAVADDPNLKIRQTALSGSFASLLSRFQELDSGQRDLVLTALRPLCNSKLSRESFDVLTKFIVQLYYPDLPLTSGTWLADREYRFGVPSVPMELTQLSNILNYFVGEENGVTSCRLSLANSKDLQNVEGVAYEGEELVGDNLTNKFRLDVDSRIQLRDLSVLSTWEWREAWDAGNCNGWHQ